MFFEWGLVAGACWVVVLGAFLSSFGLWIMDPSGSSFEHVHPRRETAQHPLHCWVPLPSCFLFLIPLDSNYIMFD